MSVVTECTCDLFESDDLCKCEACGSWFSRSECVCESMHYFCEGCGGQVDDCC